VSRLISLVVDHRRLVLAVVTLVTLFLGAGASKLSIVIDPDETLPQDHPYLVATNLADKLFGNKFAVIIGVTPPRGDALQPAAVAVVKEITAKLAADRGVVPSSLVSLTARKVKDIGGSADGLTVRQLAEGKSGDAPERLRQALARNPVYQDLLISPDGRTTGILAEFKKDPGGFKAIAARVEAIVAPHRAAGYDVAVGGQPIFLGLTENFSDRMGWLFPVALVVVGLIHFEAFRSIQGLLLPLVTGLLAVAWALGIMGWAGTSLDAFNATTPILILAVSAGHAVQILKRYYEEFRSAVAAPGIDRREANRRAIVTSLGATGPVMVAAGLTAAASFSSLVVFDVATIRTFGIFTALGIVSALAIELTFIPALRAMLPPPSPKQIGREENPGYWSLVCDKLALLSIRAPRRVMLASAAFLVVMAGGASLVVIDNSLRSYFLSSLDVRQQDARLNERLAGNNVLYVLVKGKEDDAIKSPEVLRAMEATQRFLEAERPVGKTVSLVDFIRRIDGAMNGDATAGKLPDSQDLVAQYLLLYSMSGEPEDFKSHVDYGYRNAVITAYLKEESSIYLTDLSRRLAAFARERFPGTVEVSIGGNVMSPVALNEVLVGNKLVNIVQIALSVFVIASILFRSIIGGLFVLVPLVVAVAANFGIMGLAGIPLQVATATVSAMAVGIGADYAIYLLYRLREEARGSASAEFALRRTFRSAGKAVLFVASAVSGGYAVLMFSYGFLIHFWLGFLICVAMLVSAGAALTTLAAMIMHLRPAFLFGRVGAAYERHPLPAAAAALLLACLVAAPASAAELTPEAVMQRNFVALKVADSTSDATFTLRNADGQERVRKTHTWTKLQPNGSDNMRLVRFLSPQDVRSTATLTIENADRDDDIWIYLPALKKTRRLLASNKKDSFVGTDFSYGDIIGFKVAEWRHAILREEAVDGAPCYVVESAPGSAEVQENSGYSKRLQWIRKDNFIAVKGEFYDVSGRLLKTITASELREIDPAKGRWQAMRLEARNVQSGHSTTIELQNFKANQGLSAQQFAARELEREQ
jgi:predicted RND superfamily exporter protein/outer membrane lipoprotein-sorting protein